MTVRMNRLALALFMPILLLACGRPEGSGGPDAASSASGLTWYRDVLPIAQKNCQGCHVAGGLAPFPLTEYQDAFVWHAAMADAVAARRMPPWLADESCVALKNSRRLSTADIDVITRWSAAGAAAGDPADAPPPPQPRQGLAWVSATVDPGADYVPNVSVTNPDDDYHCFLLPPAFTAPTDLIGFEVVPGTPQQVHHVILFAVPATDAQALDDKQSGLGWTCYGGPGVPAANLTMLGGWVPGTGVTRYPDGTAIQAQAGQVVVMQVHYNLSHGAPVADRTRVNLQYAQQPGSTPARIIPFIDDQFVIPAARTGYTHSRDITLPPPSPFFRSAVLWGVTPHMHELGRRIHVQNVTAPQCLIDVPNWDFHWQQPYEYATPLTVSAGDTIRISCTWDNPTSADVQWGESTADEMCVAFFYATLP
jgi:hypothetical protein